MSCRRITLSLRASGDAWTVHIQLAHIAAAGGSLVQPVKDLRAGAPELTA